MDVRKCTSDAPNILHESTQTSADDCREEVRINGGPSEQQVESEEPASEVITTSDLVPNTVLISSTSDAKHEDLNAASHVNDHAVAERLSENTVVKHSAEVSIARQISVTRRQRQLLVPIASESERLVDRQPMMPTLVDVRSGQGHTARKSQRVLIEST